MKTLNKKLASAYAKACTKVYVLAKKHATTLMFLFGTVLLLGGLHEISAAQYTQQDYDDVQVRTAVDSLFCLIEGAFGALIMVVAGLGAIVAAAMGAYRAAVGMLVVAVGAFILRALVSLFFGTDFSGATGTCG